MDRVTLLLRCADTSSILAPANTIQAGRPFTTPSLNGTCSGVNRGVQQQATGGLPYDATFSFGLRLLAHGAAGNYPSSGLLNVVSASLLVAQTGA